MGIFALTLYLRLCLTVQLFIDNFIFTDFNGLMLITWLTCFASFNVLSFTCSVVFLTSYLWFCVLFIIAFYFALNNPSLHYIKFCLQVNSPRNSNRAIQNWGWCEGLNNSVSHEPLLKFENWRCFVLLEVGPFRPCCWVSNGLTKLGYFQSNF